jgi:hypothetical protein
MSHALTLSESEKNALRAAVESSSLVRVAQWLGVARPTVERALAGLPVRAGSVALLRLGMGGRPSELPGRAP